MTSAADVVSAVDGLLSTPKLLVGADAPPTWAQGHSPQEQVIYLPLEIKGEQTGAKLMVVGFPRERSLKFRLGILFPGSVCRLDYTDETHPNMLRLPQDGNTLNCEGAALSLVEGEPSFLQRRSAAAESGTMLSYTRHQGPNV